MKSLSNFFLLTAVIMGGLATEYMDSDRFYTYICLAILCFTIALSFSIMIVKK